MDLELLLADKGKKGKNFTTFDAVLRILAIPYEINLL